MFRVERLSLGRAGIRSGIESVYKKTGTIFTLFLLRTSTKREKDLRTFVRNTNKIVLV